MHLNAKVALLLLGMLAGGVAGYLTKPIAVEIVRIDNTQGGAPPMPAASMPPMSTDRSGDLLAQSGGRILIFAAGGGIIGLLAGFAAGRR